MDRRAIALSILSIACHRLFGAVSTGILRDSVLPAHVSANILASFYASRHRTACRSSRRHGRSATARHEPIRACSDARVEDHHESGESMTLGVGVGYPRSVGFPLLTSCGLGSHS